MKKIKFYILKTENINNAGIYFDRFRNSLIRKEEDKIFFSSMYNGTQEITVEYGVLESYEELSKTIDYLLDISYKEAKLISKENMGTEKTKGQMAASLISVLNKYEYSESEADIFDLATEMFIKLLNGHYLGNGNKRTSITFLKFFLWELGYYLKWTGGHFKDYREYEDTLKQFVVDLENTTDKTIKSDIFKRIKEWITGNVIIGLNWRNND